LDGNIELNIDHTHDNSPGYIVVNVSILRPLRAATKLSAPSPVHQLDSVAATPVRKEEVKQTKKKKKKKHQEG
jgi:hypothetical protein